MKKWILSLLVVVCVACGAFGLAACVPSQYQGGGHNFSEAWSHDIDHHWHKCIDCSRTTDTAEHTLALIVDEVYYREATCDTVGRGLYQCVDCGAYIVDVIPTIEHNYEFSYWLVEPTCDTDGQAMYVCTECGDPVSRVEEALGNHQYGDTWLSNSQGHYKICLNCGQSGEVTPHTEVRDPRQSYGASGMDDGLNVFVCEECGAFIRNEKVENPNVPVTLSITLNGATIVDDEYGNHTVTLTRGTQYTIGYIARTKGGATVNQLRAVMNGDSGVKAYIVNEMDGFEEMLDIVSNADRIRFGFTSNTTSYLNVEIAGEYLVRFKYETSIGTSKHEVRATYDIRIMSGTRALSANELGIQMYAIDDAAACLNIGAYDVKSR